MSPAAAEEAAVVRRFPRVSGDEPARRTPVIRWAGFSPRERG